MPVAEGNQWQQVTNPAGRVSSDTRPHGGLRTAPDATAALIRAAASRGDRLAVRRLTERFSATQMADLVLALAAAPPAPAPLTEAQLAHRAAHHYRRQGLLLAGMPAWVAKGEREYQRERKARNRREQVIAARRREAFIGGTP